MNFNKKKGIEMQYMFLFMGLIFTIIILYSWNARGMEIASERLSEFKKLTITQVKNILFTMQYAPLETQACAPLKYCKQVTIHRDFIEILGNDNKYFKEGEYVSDSLVGNMDIYYEDETCKAEGEQNCWVKLGKDGFSTTCGTLEKPLYICFEKVLMDGEEVIRIKRHIS